MEAEVRSYEFSESRSLYDRLYRNNQGSLLSKFFEYLFQGEIIYLRGRLLISGGDIFICLCYKLCNLSFAMSFFLIANSYHLYMFLSSSKRGRLLEQDLFLSIILVLMITII